jgi:hypothetical protein
MIEIRAKECQQLRRDEDENSRRLLPMRLWSRDNV